MRELRQNALENVLKALSVLFKDMGYCQGLNFIAALFVLYMNDEVTQYSKEN